MIEEALKDLANMLDMFFMGAVCVYEDIVEISDTEFI
jgi:hypothetical protein